MTNPKNKDFLTKVYHKLLERKLGLLDADKEGHPYLYFTISNQIQAEVMMNSFSIDFYFFKRISETLVRELKHLNIHYRYNGIKKFRQSPELFSAMKQFYHYDEWPSS